MSSTDRNRVPGEPQDSPTLCQGDDDGSAHPVRVRPGNPAPRAEREAAVDTDGTRSEWQGAEDRPAPGTTIGDFLLGREIGRGGMGVVYEATEQSLNRRVALKVLPLAALIDRRQIRRFHNEALAAAQLYHPHIVPVYSVGVDRGIHYYAMQLIEGRNLADIISSVRRREQPTAVVPLSETPRIQGNTVGRGQHAGRRSPAESHSGNAGKRHTSGLRPAELVAAISSHRTGPDGQTLFRRLAAMGADIADALGHAHDAGIIHRDIKPSNLMLDEQGKLWVADFGLALIRNNPEITDTGDVVGTLRYMSPEQATGKRFLVDHRADIYSLAVTLYELLTLRSAFDAEDACDIVRQVSFGACPPVRRLNPAIPEELETVISRAMALHPHERYESAAEFAEELRQVAHNKPIRTRRPGPLRRCQQWVARHRNLATSVAAGLIFAFVLATGTAGLIWQALSAESQQRQRAVSLLETSEGLRLVALANLELGRNPGRALALAVAGADRVSGLEVNQTLQAATDAGYERHTLQLREQPEGQIAISHDGRLAVSTVQSWYADSGPHPAIITHLDTGVEVLRIGEESLTSAVFVPGGNWLLSTATRMSDGDDAGTASAEPATLWDLRSGRREIVYRHSQLRTAHSGLFSPGSDLVALPVAGNGVSLFSVSTGDSRLTQPEHQAPVLTACFSPDGRHVASMDAAGGILVWDAATADIHRRIQRDPPPDPDVRLRFSHDGTRLLAGDHHGTHVYGTGAAAGDAPLLWQEPLFSVHPGSALVACWHRYGHRLFVRDLTTGDTRTEISLPAGCAAAQFSSGGDVLVLASGRSLILVDPLTGETTARMQGHEEPLITCAISPDGRSLISAATDRTVRIWNRRSHAEQRRFAANAASEHRGAYAFASDDRRFVVASDSMPEVRILGPDGEFLPNAVSGRLRGEFCNSELLCVADGQVVHAVNPATSRVVARLPLPAVDVHDIRPVGHTGQFVVLTLAGHGLLWDPASGAVRMFGSPERQVRDAAVSRDGSRAAFARSDGQCLIVDTATKRVERTLAHRTGIVAVAFIPESERIVTVDATGRALMWNETDSPLAELTREDHSVSRAAATADGRFVLTWHDWHSGHVCCWDAASGEFVRDIAVPDNTVLSLHETRPLAALASQSGGLRTWSFDDGTETQLTDRPTALTAFVGDTLYAISQRPQNDSDVAASPRRDGWDQLTGWDIPSGNRTTEIPLPFEPEWLSRDEVSQCLVVSGSIYRALLCDPAEPARVTAIGSHRGPLTLTAWAGPARGNIVTASRDATGGLWTPDGRRLAALEGHSAPIEAGAVSPDGALVATGDRSGRVILWNAADGSRIAEPSPHAAAVVQLAFDVHSQCLLSVGIDGQVSVTDTRTGETISVPVTGGVLYAEFLRDPNGILVVPGQDTIEDQLRDPDGNAWRVRRLEKRGDTADALLIRWRHGTTTELRQEGITVAAHADPTSDRCVLVAADGTAELIDGASGETVMTISGGTPVRAAAFSASGTRLATLHDLSISIWDITGDDAVERHRVSDSDRRNFAPGMTPRAIAAWNPFSPDGARLVWSRRRVEYWPADPQAAAAAAAPRTLFPEERRRFAVGLADLATQDGDGR